MKHVALILAGGSGQRMQQNVPKQFLHINEKPLLIYTLEAFQRHPEIEKILVVCIDGWHEMLRAYARQFQIDKLEWIISGGGTSQESIRNGVFFLERICGEEDTRRDTPAGGGERADRCTQDVSGTRKRRYVDALQRTDFRQGKRGMHQTVHSP